MFTWNTHKFSRSHELGVAKPAERPKRVLITTLLHQPTGRLRAEPDENQQQHRRDEGSGELKAPSEASNVHEDKVRTEATAAGQSRSIEHAELFMILHKDTESDPQLKACHHTTPNDGRRNFSAVDGYGRDIDAHTYRESVLARFLDIGGLTKAHEKTTDHETPPVLGESLCKDREGRQRVLSQR